MTMSPYNSDDEVDNKGFRELSYEEIEQELEKYYNQNDSLIMNELDAMMTYIKGQKHLFQHAKQYSEYNLNLLIVPSILISAFIAVFFVLFGAVLLESWLYCRTQCIGRIVYFICELF